MELKGREGRKKAARRGEKRGACIDLEVKKAKKEKFQRSVESCSLLCIWCCHGVLVDALSLFQQILKNES